MKERGIMTTDADYWVHLFPLTYDVYWYRVAHCRAFIERKNVPVKLGKSKDGTATGNGYLIPKNAFFVSKSDVPAEYVGHANWDDEHMTDREAGFLGELVIAALMEHRVLRFPSFTISTLRSKEDQFRGSDFEGEWFKQVRIEAKTERVHSDNLFVQTHEGGHRVHQVRTDSGVETRVTDAPPLEETSDALDDEIPF